MWEWTGGTDMSGRRTKALRRQYRREHGRAPNKAVVELRERKTRMSADGALGAAVGKIVRWFQGTVVSPNEFRRYKKLHQRAS